MLIASPSLSEIERWTRDARDRTLEWFRDLAGDALLGPRLATVNPPLWEVAHVAWFQEKWILRHALGRAPVLAQGDALYDSSAVPHDTRWDLPLPDRATTLGYLTDVRDRALAALPELFEKGQQYFAMLAVFHEDMHDEAFAITRQTLGLAMPAMDLPAISPPAAGPWPGDAAVPGGRVMLGGSRDEPFVFDNEKWEHPREVRPFRIARAPVTQAEMAAFVEDGGYERRELWSDAGWTWRAAADARHPVAWRRGASGWERRQFDRWGALEPHRPVVHVAFWEAEAYCRWAGRRLPTELEWEVAALYGRDGAKRRFPWGDAPIDETRACLDWRARGTVDVAAFAEGDSAFGCRQMIGNVWEWTSTDLGPFPGFVVDPYADYSKPWFGDHKVLRGGAWTTRARLLRGTWRNFYQPHRRDPWAGFRTCALD